MLREKFIIIKMKYLYQIKKTKAKDIMINVGVSKTKPIIFDKDIRKLLFVCVIKEFTNKSILIKNPL